MSTEPSGEGSGAPEDLLARILAHVDVSAFPTVETARHFAAGFVGDPLGRGVRTYPPERVGPLLGDLFQFFREPPSDPGRVDLKRDPPVTLVGGTAVLRTTTHDARFLVDSLKQVVERAGNRVRLVLHPIFQVQRDEAGELISLERAVPGALGERESLVHLELDPLDEAGAELLRAEARQVLGAAHAAVDDFDRMRARVATVTRELATTNEGPPPGSPVLDTSQVSAFARWLLDDSFLFLGARTYLWDDGVEPVAGSELGILRDGFVDDPPRVEDVFTLPRRLIVDKTHATSPIHRLVAMDEVAFRFFENGRVQHEERFLGLFTRKAVREQPTRIPILSEKLKRIFRSAGVIDGGYDARELTTAFNNLPIEGLFLTDPDTILEAMRAFEAAYEAQTVKLVLRTNLTGTLHAVGMAVPDRLAGFEQMERVVRLVEERLGDRVLERREGMVRNGLRQIYLYVPRDVSREVDPEALQTEVRQVLEPWDERFLALAAPHPDRQVYAAAFPHTYRDVAPPARAGRDLELFDRLSEDRPVAVVAVHPGDVVGGDGAATQLRIAQCEPMGLGVLMPVLRDFAVDVLDEAHYRLEPAGKDPVFLDVLRVRGRGGVDIVVAQGYDAGGHTGRIGTLTLLPAVLDTVDIPVVAAGGIGDGRGIAAALVMGAIGVWMGTRFVACQEAYAHDAYKQRIVEIDEEGTTRTRCFSGKPCRVIKNDTTEAWEAQELIEKIEPFPMQLGVIAKWLGADPYLAARREGKIEVGAMAAGQSSSLIHDVISRLTPKTRMVILNSPANPTGGVTGREALETVLEALRDRPDVWIFSDEIYSRLIYDGLEHVSPLSDPDFRERVVLLDGFSKTYAMTGWRLGYGVMRPDLAELVAKLMVNSNSCTASFTQMAGIEALTGDQSGADKMRDEFDRRRSHIVKRLNEVPGFRCHKPQGAFYVFPNIQETGMRSNELQNLLLEDAGVASLAGTAFGAEGEGYLRFSYAASIETLDEGVDRVRRAIESR